jgi:hypothetical protein
MSDTTYQPKQKTKVHHNSSGENHTSKQTVLLTDKMNAIQQNNYLEHITKLASQEHSFENINSINNIEESFKPVTNPDIIRRMHPELSDEIIQRLIIDIYRDDIKTKTAKYEKGHTVVTMIEGTFSSGVINQLKGTEEYNMIRLTGDPYKLMHYIRTVYMVNKTNESAVDQVLESAKRLLNIKQYNHETNDDFIVRFNILHGHHLAANNRYLNFQLNKDIAPLLVEKNGTRAIHDINSWQNHVAPTPAINSNLNVAPTPRGRRSAVVNNAPVNNNPVQAPIDEEHIVDAAWNPLTTTDLLMNQAFLVNVFMNALNSTNEHARIAYKNDSSTAQKFVNLASAVDFLKKFRSPVINVRNSHVAFGGIEHKPNNKIKLNKKRNYKHSGEMKDADIEEIKCYKCQGIGHRSNVCPTVTKGPKKIGNDVTIVKAKSVKTESSNDK